MLVTFERDILEELAQIKKENKLELELYGMGRTNKILSYLEEDIINSVAVQNEFNLGYLGVKIAVDKLNNKDTSGKTIDFSIINKSNMYRDNNRKNTISFYKVGIIWLGWYKDEKEYEKIYISIINYLYV